MSHHEKEFHQLENIMIVLDIISQLFFFFFFFLVAN